MVTDETVKDAATAAADYIDSMLELDQQAAIAWRLASERLRAGDVSGAMEFLAAVRDLCERARVGAETAAAAIVVLATAEKLRRMTPPHDMKS